MTQKVFFIAGEHSGDVLGAGLIKALKEQSAVEISGIGGPLMSEQGLRSLIPMEELCVMGLWEVVGQLPRLMKLINAVLFEIEKFKPDVVITIDLPDFNFQVAQRLKKRNFSGKIIHYVAPSVWAWRPGRAKKISKFFDGLICLFPHEPPYFKKHGLRSEFIGHPLTENNLENADGKNFRERLEITDDVMVLGLFLGSRERELQTHSAIFKEVVFLLKQEYPNIQVLLPTLPSLEYEIKTIMQDADFPALVLVNPDEKWDEFAACNYALAVSGTVGLELAYMGIPHVIAYRMHPLSWLAVKAMVKTKYAHLANILLRERVIPEFLQSKCNSIDVAKGLLKLMKDEGERQKQLSVTPKLRAMLRGKGDKTPSQKAADFVLKIAAGDQSRSSKST